MNHFIFTAARLYPYWAAVCVFLALELAQFCRRRRRTKGVIFFLLIALTLLAGVVAWFFYRGDLHSDQWVRTILGD